MKTTLLAFMIVGCAMVVSAQPPDALHGNLITPTIVFFDKPCAKAVTVSLADVVLWDVPSGKALNRIDLANNIREYNPFTTTLKLNAAASLDLHRVLVELSTDEQRFGFIFDTRTGKLSEDDAYYNDKALGFDANGDYIVFRNLRTNNGPAGERLEIGLAGSKTTMGVLSEFKPTLASRNGEIVYGEDLKSEKLVIYHLTTGKTTKTKIKFDPKVSYWYYLMHPWMYTNEWVYVPGKDWFTFYNPGTEEFLHSIDGLKGPYGFSDNGKYAYYYREGTPWQFVLRDVKTKEEFTAQWTSGYTAYMYNARIPEDGSLKIYQLEGSVEKKEGRIVVYDIKNGSEVHSFNIMALPEVIEINRSLRENHLGGSTQTQTHTETQTTSQNQSGYTNESGYSTKADGSGKKLVQDYETFDGFIINYDQLPLPWQLDYNTIQGRDVSNYKHKDKISYGHLSGSSLNAIGKVFAQEGNIGLLSMYRRIQGSLDYSWFKISVFDMNGNHLQTENIGNTQKDASGVPFRVDFWIEDTGAHILIHVSQKTETGIQKKIMTVDKYNGTIK
jgi:hypothetical protein